MNQYKKENKNFQKPFTSPTSHLADFAPVFGIFFFCVFFPPYDAALSGKSPQTPSGKYINPHSASRCVSSGCSAVCGRLPLHGAAIVGSNRRTTRSVSRWPTGNTAADTLALRSRTSCRTLLPRGFYGLGPAHYPASCGHERLRPDMPAPPLAPVRPIHTFRLWTSIRPIFIKCKPPAGASSNPLVHSQDC